MGVSGTSKVYDATMADTITGTATLSASGSDSVTLNTSSAADSFGDKNVGTGKAVTFTGYGISGTDSGNYTLAQPVASTADITPASLTVTDVSGTSKVYDATMADTITGTATPRASWAATKSRSIRHRPRTASATRTSAPARPSPSPATASASRLPRNFIRLPSRSPPPPTSLRPR